MSEYKTRSITELLGTGDTIVSDTFKSIKAYRGIVGDIQDNLFQEDIRKKTASNYIVNRMGSAKIDIKDAMSSGDTQLAGKLINNFDEQFSSMKTDDQNIKQHYKNTRLQNERAMENIGSLETTRQFLVENNTVTSIKDFEHYQSLDKDDFNRELKDGFKTIEEQRLNLVRRGMNDKDYAWVHEGLNELEMDYNALKILAAGDGELNGSSIEGKMWENYKHSGKLTTLEDEYKNIESMKIGTQTSIDTIEAQIATWNAEILEARAKPNNEAEFDEIQTDNRKKIQRAEARLPNLKHQSERLTRESEEIIQMDDAYHLTPEKDLDKDKDLQVTKIEKDKQDAKDKQIEADKSLVGYNTKSINKDSSGNYPSLPYKSAEPEKQKELDNYHTKRNLKLDKYNKLNETLKVLEANKSELKDIEDLIKIKNKALRSADGQEKKDIQKEIRDYRKEKVKILSTLKKPQGKKPKTYLGRFRKHTLPADEYPNIDKQIKELKKELINPQREIAVLERRMEKIS